MEILKLNTFGLRMVFVLYKEGRVVLANRLLNKFFTD